MAQYPGSIVSYTNPQGGSLLTNPDHAGMHTSENNELVAIEQFLGTNSASNGVFSGYQAGWVPLALSGGTPQTSLLHGTYPNATLGTPAITGGTYTAPVFAGNGTNSGTIANGVYNNANFGTSQWTGGTLAPSVVQGSVIGSANILDGNVPERKIRMDQLAGTVLTSGSTSSSGLAGIPGGSVTINFNVASNVMIYFSSLVFPSGGAAILYALYINGVKDTTWNDTNGAGGWNTQMNSFTAWRTGLAAGLGTFQMQWRIAGSGTASIQGFEFIVQPFSQ